MDPTPNDAERLAYKERQHNVITSNASIVDYSFDLQEHKWCQFVLKVLKLELVTIISRIQLTTQAELNVIVCIDVHYVCFLLLIVSNSGQ